MRRACRAHARPSQRCQETSFPCGAGAVLSQGRSCGSYSSAAPARRRTWGGANSAASVAVATHGRPVLTPTCQRPALPVRARGLAAGVCSAGTTRRSALPAAASAVSAVSRAQTGRGCGAHRDAAVVTQARGRGPLDPEVPGRRQRRQRGAGRFPGCGQACAVVRSSTVAALAEPSSPASSSACARPGDRDGGVTARGRAARR